jgi:hypothetical protein
MNVNSFIGSVDAEALLTMNMITLTKLAVAAAAITTMSFTAHAVVDLDFGSTWPTPLPASSPYDRILGVELGTMNEAGATAWIGQTFVAANTVTPATGDEINPPDGYFTVSGWDYIVVQYGGNGGGVHVAIQLDGLSANIPFDSAFLNVVPGAKGGSDKFAVSHYMLSGSHTVPDGGMTVALLGLGSLALAGMRRKA